MSFYPNSPFRRANPVWLRAIIRARYVEEWRATGSLYDDNFASNMTRDLLAEFEREFGELDDTLPEQYFEALPPFEAPDYDHYDWPVLYEREHLESLARLNA